MGIIAKAMCEDELLENYNSRDNLEILGFPEQVRRDASGNNLLKKYEQTISYVIQRWHPSCLKARMLEIYFSLLSANQN